VSYLLPFWNYRLSFWLTLLTGLLLLWQYPGAKGTAGHVTRWALALFLSVFVVYMNTATVMNQPPVQITNSWHIRLMEFHQNVGLIYFALMALIPFLGGALMVAVRRGGRTPATLRAVHKWVGYAAGISWLASNIASEIGSRIPRT
jgi:cytochrome b561